MAARTKPIEKRRPGLPAVHRGRVVAVDEAGGVFVAVGRERPARAAVAFHIDRRALDEALAAQADALLFFEEGDAARPIVVGFVGTGPASEVARSRALPAFIEADVDNKRIRVVARDEMVFECGKASITMRRNGKVIVRGTHVETNSDGTNRIKGGQVKIN